MRIHGENLKKVAASRGTDAVRLGAAIERAGLKGDDAVRAINNWMVNRDHPRCKAADIKRLAAALQVEPSAIARFECYFRVHRGSARKAGLLADLIRGKRVDVAENLLTFTTKRAAIDILTALRSAIADAEQANADVGSLVVELSTVQKAQVMKRFQPKDRGRAHSILKPMSHIKIGLVAKGA